MNKQIRKLIVFVLSVCVMAMSAANLIGCDNSGSFALKSIAVSGESVKTTYTVGEAVDFSGISVVATFSDKTQQTITLNDLELFAGDKKLEGAVAEGLTEEEGEIEITVKYTYNGKEKSAAFKIKVIKEIDSMEGFLATSFAYNNEAERMSAATDTGADYETDKLNFEGQFYASEEVVRLVGDDNAFIYEPTLVLENDDAEPIVPSTYYFDAEIFEVGEEEVKLTAEAGENRVVNYSLGGEEILSLDMEKFAYDFTENAIGREFKISVKPTDFYLLGPAIKAIEINVKVVDGFNVYKATDLAVIDNVASEAWFDIKTANNLLGVSPKAVILQNNIAVTEEDIPASYCYSLTREPVYYSAQDHENPLEDAEVSNKRIDDGVLIYHREMKTGSFAIEGNFFTLDFTAVPVASAFADGAHDGYGSDFSNVAAICLDDTAETVEAREVEYSISNIKAIGNAARSQLEEFDAANNDFKPVNAGGLIFLRIDHNKFGKIKNVIANTFFIGWISHESTMTVENMKCYESYQNAGFIWGESNNTVRNCDLERSGGPLFILQHIDPANYPDSRIPVINVYDSHLEALVTGQELWFKSMGATDTFGLVRDICEGVANMANRTVVNNGKLNLVAITLADVNNATDALTGVGAQGFISVHNGEKAYGINRLFREPTAYTQTLQFLLGKGAPVVSVDDSGCYWLDAQLQPNYQPINGDMDATNYAIYTADYITLNYGGLGIMLEMF